MLCWSQIIVSSLTEPHCCTTGLGHLMSLQSHQHGHQQIPHSCCHVSNRSILNKISRHSEQLLSSRIIFAECWSPAEQEVNKLLHKLYLLYWLIISDPAPPCPAVPGLCTDHLLDRKHKTLLRKYLVLWWHVYLIFSIDQTSHSFLIRRSRLTPFILTLQQTGQSSQPVHSFLPCRGGVVWCGPTLTFIKLAKISLQNINCTPDAFGVLYSLTWPGPHMVESSNSLLVAARR